MKYLIPVLFLISCSSPQEELPETTYVYLDTVVTMEERTDSVVHMMDEKLEFYKQKKAAEKKAMDSMSQLNKMLRYEMRIQRAEMLQKDTI